MTTTKKRGGPMSAPAAGRTSSKRLKEASPETLRYVDALLSVFERAIQAKRRSVLAESFGRGYRLVEMSGGRKVRRDQ